MDKLDELNDILYKQLIRLSDNLPDNELTKEIERSKAMAIVASQFIASSTLKVRKELMIEGKTYKTIDYRGKDV